MQTAETFLNAGWDFMDEAAHGLHGTWQMPERGGYPVLTAFNGYAPPQLPGRGTRDEPYLISDARELAAMIHYRPDAHYRLTASIDLSGIRWSREVIPDFAGTFDGNGHIISHLTMTGSDTLGLFRGLDVGGEVKDLGIVDANIIGSDRRGIGALMTYNWGSVTRCYVTGAVSGISEVGGLVGNNEGKVTCCYSTATVGGIYLVGGLVGRNSGTLAHCYSTGAIFGDLDVGGLVGYSDPTHGNVTGCFWDIDTSGQLTKTGGEGRTSLEMQTARTFLDAGWDFAGETANGEEDIWWILEGNGHPRLWWELIPEN